MPQSDKHDEALKAMVDRFLGWKLPEDFHPDAGISFSPFFNVEYNAKQGKPPQRHEPIGTNLLTATQAEAMLRHVAAPLLAELQRRGDAPLSAERRSLKDGMHFGNDCPKGKVQVEFVGVDPTLRYSPYGWKPSDRAFIEVWVDGHRFRIDVGDLSEHGHLGRRGIHINSFSEMKADAMNAWSLMVKEGADRG